MIIGSLRKGSALLILGTLLSLLVLAPWAGAKEVTDIFGRSARIPDRAQRVYSPSPPVTYLLYALDPAILAGLNFPVRPWEKKYLNKSMPALPILGGWYGQAQTPNIEAILKVRPEVIIAQQIRSPSPRERTSPQ